MKALARLNRFGFGTAPAETLTLATGNKKTPSGRSPTNTPTRANNCEPSEGGATSAKTRRDFPSLPPRRRPALMKPVGIIPELAHWLNASEQGGDLSVERTHGEGTWNENGISLASHSKLASCAGRAANRQCSQSVSPPASQPAGNQEQAH